MMLLHQILTDNAEMIDKQQRTLLQNKALHKYCELLATALNDAGFDMRIVLIGSETDIRNSIEFVLNDLGVFDHDNTQFERLAESLTEAVYNIRSKEIPWTKYSVKERIWRPVQQAMLGKGSTTEMTTIDPAEIKRVIDRHLAERFGFVGPDWPSLR